VTGDTRDARAEALRRAFDGAFAEARTVRDDAGVEALLGLSAGGVRCAVRVRDVTGLHADRRVTPVPGGAPGLLGLAGLGQAIVPVYDLAFLLGRGADAAPPRWLIVAGGGAVALAFEHFDGHLLVPADAVGAETGANAPHVEAVARTPGGPRVILAVSALVGTLRQSLAVPATWKEPH